MYITITPPHWYLTLLGWNRFSQNLDGWDLTLSHQVCLLSCFVQGERCKGFVRNEGTFRQCSHPPFLRFYLLLPFSMYVHISFSLLWLKCYIYLYLSYRNHYLLHSLFNIQKTLKHVNRIRYQILHELVWLVHHVDFCWRTHWFVKLSLRKQIQAFLCCVFYLLCFCFIFYLVYV